jgi:hypothetical protein
MHSPFDYSEQFRYEIYFPLMGALWDAPPGYLMLYPDEPGFRCFPYFGA